MNDHSYFFVRELSKHLQLLGMALRTEKIAVEWNANLSREFKSFTSNHSFEGLQKSTELKEIEGKLVKGKMILTFWAHLNMKSILRKPFPHNPTQFTSCLGKTYAIPWIYREVYGYTMYKTYIY